MSKVKRQSWMLRLAQLGLALAVAASTGRAFAQSDDDPLEGTKVERVDPLQETKFKINDQDPVASVPSPQEAMKRPLDMGYQLMLLTERAEAAAKRGDHRAAAEYWLAVAKAVPDRSISFARACTEFEAAGDYANALINCRSALGRAGVTLEDNLHFVQLVLQKKKDVPDATEIADVDAVAAHLEKQLDPKQAQLVAERIRCELGSRLEDAKRLTACVQRLTALAPDDLQTLVFSWTLALKQGRLAEAEQILDRAKRAKLPDAAAQKMAGALEAVRVRQAPWWQRALRSPRALGAAAAVLLLAAAASLVNRRRHGLRTA